MTIARCSSSHLTSFVIGAALACLLGGIPLAVAGAQTSEPAPQQSGSTLRKSPAHYGDERAQPSEASDEERAPAATSDDVGTEESDTEEPETEAPAPPAGHNRLSAMRSDLHSALKTFGEEMFERATEAFPAFCKDWERKLHDREVNNLDTLTWEEHDGWQTTTYVGYSPIKTCECKRSHQGVPIGELTYQESQFYLAGKTVDEARHAKPKVVGITKTTEIFRWNRTKWESD